jgi:hypothetical protein
MFMKACGALAGPATLYRFFADDLFTEERTDDDRAFEPAVRDVLLFAEREGKELGLELTRIFALPFFFPPFGLRVSISLNCSSSHAWRIGEMR